MLFGLAAIVLFILSAVFKLWSVSHGVWDWSTLAVLGLLALAIHLYPTGSSWPWRR